MTIVVTGGGSGGHITPILAVAHELKRLAPETKVIYIGQTGDPFADIPGRDDNIDEVYTVSAGKFRRYYGAGLRQLLDVKTMALNLRDLFRILRGYWQSRQLMKRLGPAVVFSRGGYVSVPVCLGAKSRRIPYLTHDSDSIPSLANRLIAPWAVKNAVALPPEIYPYDKAKTVSVGVPSLAGYEFVTPALQAQYRQQLGYAASDKIAFVIGGGLGAQRLNEAVVSSARSLFERYPTARLLHVAGQANLDIVRQQYAAALNTDQLARVEVFGYLDGVFTYSGAADVIVTRAGASSLADFAIQGKPCIVMPSPFLVGGHQLKNAQYLAEQGAIEVVTEKELQSAPGSLADRIISLLSDEVRQRALSQAFTAFGHPRSANEVARLILEEAHEAA